MLILLALLAAGAPARTFRVDCGARSFRDVASHAPYELVEIVANARTYGGGGIFNLYGTVAADSRWAPYIFVHEFAHHLAGLADEYFTSPTAYEKQADRPSLGNGTSPPTRTTRNGQRCSRRACRCEAKGYFRFADGLHHVHAR